MNYSDDQVFSMAFAWCIAGYIAVDNASVCACVFVSTLSVASCAHSISYTNCTFSACRILWPRPQGQLPLSTHVAINRAAAHHGWGGIAIWLSAVSAHLIHLSCWPICRCCCCCSERTN